MTAHPELFAALAAPFDGREVKVLAVKGREMRYITARTAMNRLDNVLGPERWWDDYIPGAESVICRLTILLPDGRELTKVDAGGYAGMADSGDDDKSGFSDAFKRAAVKFGVGRYLYRDGVPAFAEVEPSTTEQRARQAPPAAHANGDGASHDRRPVDSREQTAATSAPEFRGRTGKALFAWVKEVEQKFQVGLLKYLNGFAKLHEYPTRMVDWDEETVAFVHKEAVRKLGTIRGDGSQVPREDAPTAANGPIPPRSKDDWATFIKDRLDQAGKGWQTEMTLAGIDRAQRTHPDFQMPNLFAVTNHFVSHAIEAGAIKAADVAKDGTDKRDPAKAKAALATIYAKAPRKVRAAVEEYLSEKERGLRVALGMDDLEPADEAGEMAAGREPGQDG